MRPFLQVLVGLGLLSTTASLIACDDDSGSADREKSSKAADDDDDDDDTASAGTGDDDDVAPPTCTGACAVTAVTATTTKGSAVLARAQYGTTTLANGGPGLRAEVHLGGDEACPEEGSPTPKYTLVLSGLPAKAALGLEEAPAIGGGLFDYTDGELLDVPLAKIASVTLSNYVGDPSLDAPFYAFDVEVMLEGGGALAGHVYLKEHCGSLDE